MSSLGHRAIARPWQLILRSAPCAIKQGLRCCFGWHAEVVLLEALTALRGLRCPGMGDMAQKALDEAAHYMDEVEDDWRRVWAWLHGRTSLQQLHPGYPVHEVRGLLKAGTT